MLMHHHAFSGGTLELFAVAEAATRQIPPYWTLDATVAVNPFLGQAGEPLAHAAARLARTAGVRATPARSAMAARIEAGEIADDDLAAAIEASLLAGPATVTDLKEIARREAPGPLPLPTVADLAAEASGVD
jgi:uncharacterized protein YbcC (UPF0753/DUF2309 family)